MILFNSTWLASRHWPATCAIFLSTALSGFGESCKGKTDKEKLEDWKLMAKLHRETREENTINQSNSGDSQLNFQWACFASGASALGVVSLICGSFIICCLWKAKAGRRYQKNQERLLAAISTISSPTTGSAPSSNNCPSSHCRIRLDLYSHRVDKCTLIIRCWTQWASKAPASPVPATSYNGDFFRQVWIPYMQDGSN